jgi:hypothetical protein
MTLKELKGKYARLSNEIDTLAAEGVHHEARLMRLMSDLDEVHRELCDLRMRTFAAPTLREAVSKPEPEVAKPVAVSLAPAATAVALAPPMMLPSLSMAG